MVHAPNLVHMCSLILVYMQLVKLLESRETNHIEFCKIKSLLDDILQLSTNSKLNEILKLLMDPTWVATGLKVELDTLVSDSFDYESS